MGEASRKCPPHEWDCGFVTGPKAHAVCRKCGEKRTLDNFLPIDYGPEVPEQEARVHREGRHIIRKVKPEVRRRRRESKLEARRRYEQIKPEIIAFFRKSGGCQRATAIQFDMPPSSLRQRLIAWQVISEDGTALMATSALTLPLKAHTEAVVIAGEAAFIAQIRTMITTGTITITAQASRLLPYEYFVGEKNDATL